jgi:aspartate aminotransferase-like enzyme
MDEQIELEDALETLRSAGTKVSIKANADWKEAVIDAARQWELTQIAEALPSVHQEYAFRMENGINFPQSLVDKKREEYAFTLCEMAKQQILDGRRILGEPEDMKF